MKVAIVGNGASVLSESWSNEIDVSCDRVVRVNWYEIKGYEEWTGVRTDYWVTDLWPAKHELPYGFDEIKEVWVFPDGDRPHTLEGIYKICRPAHKVAVPIRREDYLKLYGMLPGKKWPSNGLGAVFMALDYLEPDELLLIGFDAMLGAEEKSYSYYWGDEILMERAHGHDFVAEGKALIKLAEEKRLQFTWRQGGCARFSASA